MVINYIQFGRLAELEGQPRQVLVWMIRGVTVFNEFPHPQTKAASEYLARLTAMLGVETLETIWQEVTGSPLPQAVRDYINPNRPDAGEQQQG
jgi:hypothetical protein